MDKPTAANTWSVEVTDSRVKGLLNQLVVRLEDPSDLLDTLGGLLERNINLRFATKTDPDGNAWLPLAPRTVAAYARKDKGVRQGSLLQRTNVMLQSLTHNATKQCVDVGFTDVKAAWHERGHDYMPRRSMLFGDFVAGTLGAGDQADVIAEMTSWIETLLK